jgi:uncharacterized DUF497 family protein
LRIVSIIHKAGIYNNGAEVVCTLFVLTASERRVEPKTAPVVAVAMFDAPTLETIDARREYGEIRIKAIGTVRDICLVCIYTDRGDARRIISLRLAKRKERNDYRGGTRAAIDLSKVDWAALEATDDAEIDRQIANDPDTAPVFTTDELALARRVVPPTAPDDVKTIRHRLGLSGAVRGALRLLGRDDPQLRAGSSSAVRSRPRAVAHHRRRAGRRNPSPGTAIGKVAEDCVI